MKKFLTKIVMSVVVINAVFIFGGIDSAYAMSATNVEPNSLLPGVASSNAVSFTTSLDIPADGKIKVTYGAGFDLTGVGATDGLCIMDGNFSTSVLGQEITITRSGGTFISGGTSVSCYISNVENPLVVGSTGTYTIETTDSSDIQIEIDAAVAADTIAEITSPVLVINSASQKTDGSGAVDISVTLTDATPDDTIGILLQYKEGTDCSAGTYDPTLDETPSNVSATFGTVSVENDNYYSVGNAVGWIQTSPGANTVEFDWLSATDVPTADGTYCMKFTPFDGVETGAQQTTTFTLDNTSPTDPAGFAQSSSDESSISLGWISSSDTNFDHYEIWYGQKEGSVESRASETTFTETEIDATLRDAQGIYGDDIDEDGDNDLLVLSQQGSDVTWYENDGNANFSKHVIDSSFSGAVGGEITDLDEDGDKDILVTGTFANEAVWYENDGNENFTKNSISTGIEYADEIYSADIDGDGDLDVVASGLQDTELLWQENDGSENFTPNLISSDYASGIQALHVVDLDGDGDSDIAVNNNTRYEFSWWENDGTGSFTENVISTSYNNQVNLEVVDLDEDGDLDFLADRSPSGAVVWWKNDGNQNFTQYQLMGSISSPRGLFYSDLDLDGDYDIFTGEQGLSPTDIVWGENNGNESFTSHSVTTSYLSLGEKHAIDAIDLDGDGYEDIAAGGTWFSTTKLAWYQNSGTADEWDDGDDVELATVGTSATTVNGLIANSQYYFERWAIDTYGNTSTAVPAAISVYTAAAVPGTPTIGAKTSSTAQITIEVNGNPASTEFLIQEDNSGDYVQADGSLAAAEIWQSATTWGTFTVTGLEPSSTSTFQVKARNADLIETAFGASSDAIALSNVPSAPTVSASSASTINVIINENLNTSDAEYSIAVGASYVQPGGNLDVGEVFQDYTTWGGATGVNVTGLSPATNYSVTVKARNTDLVETVASAAGTDYTLPAAPAAPTIGTITETTAQVTISTNGNPASVIFLIQESSSGTYVQADGSLSTGEIWQSAAAWGTATVTGLTPASVNTFITKAKSLALDESAFGAGTSAVALANIPSAPTVSALSTSTIKVVINRNSNSSLATYSIPVGSSFVQADGSLGAGEIFQDYTTWGGSSGITVTGLSESTSYLFTVKARNTALVATVASASGSATTQTTPIVEAPTVSSGSSGASQSSEESPAPAEVAQEPAAISEEPDNSTDAVAEERVIEREITVDERTQKVEERAAELQVDSKEKTAVEVKLSVPNVTPLVTVTVNIDELSADINELEELEKKEAVPKTEKSEEEKLIDKVLTNQETDVTKEEKAANEVVVNNLFEKHFEEYIEKDENTGKAKKIKFYSSYEEAKKAQEENPNEKIFDTSSDEDEDGVSDIYQVKKNIPKDDGDEYSLIDELVLGGDPYKSDKNLVTEIPRITNFGKGQKVRGGDVAFVVGTNKKQNLSIYILDEDKKVIKTINSRIDDGIKDVIFTQLPAGKYYAVPAGDEGQGKPVKLIVEEESDDMQLVLIDYAYLMKMIFGIVQDYDLVPEDFVPEKTYIEGYAEPGSTVIFSWKSVVLNSVVVADASQGYFKVEVPKKLAQGNHDALVYAYDEDSLVYSITRRSAFRKINE